VRKLLSEEDEERSFKTVLKTESALANIESALVYQ